MAFTREQIRESIQRAGDEHWQALIRHHRDAYPESNPTPGDVASAEAARLNDLGLGDNPNLELVESRVARVEPAVRITRQREVSRASRRRRAHVSTIAPKALGSRPSRSLARMSAGLGTRTGHARRVRPVAGRDDLGRLRELADELTVDQRLVLARQVALEMDCQEF
jgi:hypothetical protein